MTLCPIGHLHFIHSFKLNMGILLLSISGHSHTYPETPAEHPRRGGKLEIKEENEICPILDIKLKHFILYLTKTELKKLFTLSHLTASYFYLKFVEPTENTDVIFYNQTQLIDTSSNQIHV